MAIELPAQVLNVYSIEEDAEDETLIGKIQYEPDGRLTLLQAEPNQESFLANVVASMNAKDVLVEKVPPPDEAEEGTVYSKVVKRGEADFFRAFQEYLARYYGLSLG
ncbi:MAG TPA: hypothetical protein VKE94_00410 [Gemmataceae bacterium]|nr:hypothetical protein [Gemmataceae bacterium]